MDKVTDRRKRSRLQWHGCLRWQWSDDCPAGKNCQRKDEERLKRTHQWWELEVTLDVLNVDTLATPVKTVPLPELTEVEEVWSRSGSVVHRRLQNITAAQTTVALPRSIPHFFDRRAQTTSVSHCYHTLYYHTPWRLPGVWEQNSFATNAVTPHAATLPVVCL